MPHKRECHRCTSPATTSTHLAYHGLTTRLELCPRDYRHFQAVLGLHYLSGFEQADTCRRCARPAVTTDVVCLDGRTMCWSLCEEHAELVHVMLSMWIMAGQVVPDPYDSLRQRAVMPEFIAPPKPAPPVASEVPALMRRSGHLDAVARRWRISAHAHERIEGRGRQFGFTKDDVLRALDAGAFYEDPSGLGRYVRGNVSVLVDTVHDVVVTVEPNLPHWEDDNESELERA